jgi:hypothetical protein
VARPQMTYELTLANCAMNHCRLGVIHCMRINTQPTRLVHAKTPMGLSARLVGWSDAA